MKKLITAIVVFVLSCSFAYAKPVGFANSWSVMSMNDYNSNSVHVFYSPTAKYSIGEKSEFFREDEFSMHTLELNYLARRWNNPDSQGNLYFTLGAGAAENDKDYSAAGYVGMLADWEDRRYFVSYENRAMRAVDIDGNFEQKARIGLAPYVAEAGLLHTWLMVQFDHNPGVDKKENGFVITPLVRFFKGANMLETGVSDHGDLFISATVVF